MDWKREAINDLAQLRRRETAIVSISEQVAILQEDFIALRGAASDRTPIQGGGSRQEEWMLNNIVKREKLLCNLAVVQRTISGIHRALETLNGKERRTLDVLLIDRQAGGVDRLAREWSYDRSYIYRIREQALYNFTIALYGVSEM